MEFARALNRHGRISGRSSGQKTDEPVKTFPGPAPQMTAQVYLRSAPHTLHIGNGRCVRRSGITRPM
jgi:hypothetical protein